MSGRRPIAAWLLCVGLALLVVSAEAAEEPRTDGQGFAYALGRELMSPFCPGRTISSCPSDQAAELLQWMVLQEAAGATREEVVAMLEERFGEGIHSAPDAEGWGLAAWLLPGGALLLGAGLVAIVLRRMVDPAAARERADEAPAPAAEVPPGPRPVVSGSDSELEALVDAEFAASER